VAFQRLIYQKDWKRPEDFPTYEDSEAQVRADLQFHPDAVRDFLNNVLLPALEGGKGAAELKTADGPLQTVLDRIKADIQALAAGGVPSVSQCVKVGFARADWASDGKGAFALAVPKEVHKRGGAAFGYKLWQNLGDGPDNRTWNVVSTRVVRRADGVITLTAPEAYDGEIVFFGV